MIRQFRQGIHVDPDLVTGVTTIRDALNHPIGVEVFQAGTTARLFAYSRADAVALADEIGTAARIAQEARLAADTRLHREVPIPSPAEAGAHMKCPECGSVDRTTAREIIELRAVGEDLCDGCGAEILPDVCGCGSELRQHLFSGGPSFDGHPFVPMGCNCYRDTGKGEA